MSLSIYKGFEIVSHVIKGEKPSRVSVKVWKIGANHLHDAPVYFTTSTVDAIKWIDAGASVPVLATSNRRVLACFH